MATGASDVLTGAVQHCVGPALGRHQTGRRACIVGGRRDGSCRPRIDRAERGRQASKESKENKE